MLGKLLEAEDVFLRQRHALMKKECHLINMELEYLTESKIQQHHNISLACARMQRWDSTTSPLFPPHLAPIMQLGPAERLRLLKRSQADQARDAEERARHKGQTRSENMENGGNFPEVRL
jgi:hypothetical protein